MATRRNYVPITAITMLIMMILMSITSGVTTPQLPISEPMDAEGRQGSSGLSDVDCSGYTFEDLFDYNFALFNINIGTDWATAEMDATAYVNGSNSATVRENLDGLFELSLIHI